MQFSATAAKICRFCILLLPLYILIWMALPITLPCTRNWQDMTHACTGHNVKDKSLCMHTFHVKWKIIFMVTDSFLTASVHLLTWLDRTKTWWPYHDGDNNKDMTNDVTEMGLRYDKKHDKDITKTWRRCHMGHRKFDLYNQFLIFIFFFSSGYATLIRFFLICFIYKKLDYEGVFSTSIHVNFLMEPGPVNTCVAKTNKTEDYIVTPGFLWLTSCSYYLKAVTACVS